MSDLHTTSWLIGGQLRQALCKLVPFFGDVSFTVSIQNLILQAVNRFGAVVFPLRSPLIRSKLCPFFILVTWIFAIVFYSIARSLHPRARWIPRGNLVCWEMEESIWRVIVLCQFPASSQDAVYIHPFAVVSHSSLHHLYQPQDTGTPRWTVHQQSATAKKKKQKRSNVHCYRNSVCALLVTFLY